MTSRTPTRRSLLGALGASFALAGCLGGGDDASDDQPTENSTPLGTSTPVDDKQAGDEATGEWHKTASPTQTTLYEVVVSRAGVYAVGEDGMLLGRCQGIWEVIDNSVDLDVESNTLYDAAVPDDGRNVWFAGSSGAIGVYEPKTQEIIDYSAPEGKTSTWESIAVSGTHRNEYIFLANGSGELVRGKRDGDNIDWLDVREPGGGSSFTDMEFHDAGTGFLSDSSGGIYESTDAGENWNKVGIRGSEHALHAIGAADGNTVFVAADGGAIYRYNGTTWTELEAGEAAIYGIDIENRETGLACSGEGEVFSLEDGQWKRVAQPVDTNLHSIVYGNEATPHVAVGSSGVILERFPDSDGDD